MRPFHPLAITLALTLAAHSAFAEFSTIDLTPPGSTNAYAIAIADKMVVGSSDVDGNGHAWIWNRTPPGADLQPTSPVIPDSSAIISTNGTWKVGYAIVNGIQHPTLWSSNQPNSYVQLNETGYANTIASGVSGSLIVGSGTSDANQSQAVVWSDPSLAPIALTAPLPFAGTAFISSNANAIDGTKAVGLATLDNPLNLNHAALWNLANIAAPTPTDLHPLTGFQDSVANGISGNQVVGSGTLLDGSAYHALLWMLSTTDSTFTVTDLNPAGFDNSIISATNGNDQVGVAYDHDGNAHAMLWRGTAASAIDLSKFLPAGEFVSSTASGIDSFGEIVGWATDTQGNTHAIIWVPEPATTFMLAAPAILLLRRRRR